MNFVLLYDFIGGISTQLLHYSRNRIMTLSIGIATNAFTITPAFQIADIITFINIDLITIKVITDISSVSEWKV